jgi:flagellar hook-associated protein 1 FlgK
MPGLIQSLETGKRGLTANQTALTTVEHNIANVNTPGYTRQETVLEATPPFHTTIGDLGTGVRAADVRRMKDLYLDTQIQDQQANLGKMQARQPYLMQIEAAFNEANTPGLGQAMSDFFAAFRSLAENPHGIGERKVLREKATQLTNAFKRVNLALHQVEFDAQAEAAATITKINAYAEEIARLNGAIAGKGGRANDLKDQRDVLLGKLSELVEIEVLEQGQDFKVFVGGKAIVDGVRARELGYRANPRGGDFQIFFVDGSYNEDITNRIQGGRLAGLKCVLLEDVPQYLGQLDHLAYTFGHEVNSLHREGYGLDGQTGIPLFVLEKSNPASEQDASRFLALSEVVQRSDGAIAAAQTRDGLPGDNRNALALAGLWNNYVIADPGSTNPKTFAEYLGGIGSDIGAKIDRGDTEQKTTQGLLGQLMTQRDAVSGVSLDEELVTLTRYQRAFQASSQSLIVTQTLFDSLLSIVRGT